MILNELLLFNNIHLEEELYQNRYRLTNRNFVRKRNKGTTN